MYYIFSPSKTILKASFIISKAITTIHTICKNYVEINSFVVKVDSCQKLVLNLKNFESYDE